METNIKRESFVERLMPLMDYYNIIVMKLDTLLRIERGPYHIPSITELYIGLKCEKFDEDLAGKAFSMLMERKLIFEADYEVDRNTLFVPHEITQRDMQFYSLNPHHLKLEIRIKK